MISSHNPVWSSHVDNFATYVYVSPAARESLWFIYNYLLVISGEIPEQIFEVIYDY